MDWVLVFALLIPILPGFAIGLVVRLWARDERIALLSELAAALALAIVAGLLAGNIGYAVWALVWMLVGAQGAALLVSRRNAST